MIKMLKSKKGMSIIEVILALTVLSIVSIPLMTSFGNSIKLTKHIDKEIDINAISRVAIERVTEALVKGNPLPDEQNSGAEIKLRELISDTDASALLDSELAESNKIGIIDSYGNLIPDYYVVVSYCKDFFDPVYKIRYVLIEIKNANNDSNVNQIKIAVDY